MRYAVARYQENRRNLACRIYYAECLRILTENTAKLSGGAAMNTKLDELLHPKPADSRSGEEIFADLVNLTGMEVI